MTNAGESSALAEFADDSEVVEFVELLQSLLESRRPPAGPIAQPWSFGVGALLAEHPKVPKRLRGMIGRFGRFGRGKASD